MDDFEATSVDVRETHLFVRRAGKGPPLLMLHGFPQTHLMWRLVAPALVRHFTVVCADLRGYGDSGCPDSDDAHGPYAKRAMARDLVILMERLGFASFAVAGHDRGGRVAYRLALDHPRRVTRLAVLDVLPTSTVWEHADARLALAYWPWSMLAQPMPLPERLLQSAAEAVVDAALDGWGPKSDAFTPAVRAAYAAPLRDPSHAHAICEEYRAAATLDREHDAADRSAGRRIACPVVVLWSKGDALDTWYADAGGPLSLWRSWCDDVRGQALDGGHFFPETRPDETVRALEGFFRAAGD
ncbi:alpha/beta hydrolase [Piscinibacter sp. XHJ-5]|uniref:alpha/beta fold hydrolase n=1 Tax=Piscinibacter sp. XHJ-5 TaxID=3037797 RepID=UPI00245339B7|nr:alpha/beta hydrolase [Piscinibacter sp. XHJ-5]